MQKERRQFLSNGGVFLQPEDNIDPEELSEEYNPDQVVVEEDEQDGL